MYAKTARSFIFIYLLRIHLIVEFNPLSPETLVLTCPGTWNPINVGDLRNKCNLFVFQPFYFQISISVPEKLVIDIFIYMYIYYI